jgi:hypothetical protein
MGSDEPAGLAPTALPSRPESGPFVAEYLEALGIKYTLGHREDLRGESGLSAAVFRYRGVTLRAVHAHARM